MRVLAIMSGGISLISIISMIGYGIVSLFAAGYIFMGCAISTFFLGFIGFFVTVYFVE